jgi:hypothetical protein
MWIVELNVVDGLEAKAMCVPFKFFQDALAYANLAAQIFQGPGKRAELGQSDRHDDRVRVWHLPSVVGKRDETK